MLVLFIINSNVAPKQPNIKEIYTNKSFFTKTLFNLRKVRIFASSNKDNQPYEYRQTDSSRRKRTANIMDH